MQNLAIKAKHYLDARRGERISLTELAGAVGASPFHLQRRFKQAYGVSPRMRFDIVLNNLSGLAWTTNKIAMTSDGTPWRPLVHVLDICKAIVCSLEAPREAISNVLRSHAGVRALFDNRWLHLFALDDTGQMAWRYSGDLEWESVVEEGPVEAFPEMVA